MMKSPRQHFVVHQHTTPQGVHWDLMLERKDTLWTWRIDIHPENVRQPVIAERIFDHPLRFLTYEGPVQNGAGHVKIVDKGDLQIKKNDTQTVFFLLYGRHLKGMYTLEVRNSPLWLFSPVENDTV